MKRSICTLLGILLLFLAAALHLSNEAENVHAAHASAQMTASLRSRILDRTEAIEEVSSEYIGILSIPKLELELPVRSDWSEELLKTAPCRFSGSIEEGNLVIMAHNYRAHFGPIRRLKPDDDVVLTEINGATTCYKVASTATVDPADADAVTESGYDLTLFTCTYGSQTRTVVFCAAEPP